MPPLCIMTRRNGLCHALQKGNLQLQNSTCHQRGCGTDYERSKLPWDVVTKQEHRLKILLRMNKVLTWRQKCSISEPLQGPCARYVLCYEGCMRSPSAVPSNLTKYT
jgi:hypothetical protein